MKLAVENGFVIGNGARVRATHTVTHAIQVENRIYVIYDYMEFPQKQPARNLFAYDLCGNELWRAQDIGCGSVDAYTNFIAEKPLTVYNFGCFICIVNEIDGQIVSTHFTK